ncbi:hypothetical protein EDD85DRAFT_793629 [Armillaria nabsnona]|nr:hypothetical protein EDD85DRAFT_793629 [Armillaria nabsnona]
MEQWDKQREDVDSTGGKFSERRDEENSNFEQQKPEVNVLFTKFVPEIDVSEIHFKDDGGIRRQTIPMESVPRRVLSRIDRNGPRRHSVYVCRSSLQRYTKDIETTLCRGDEGIEVVISGGSMIRSCIVAHTVSLLGKLDAYLARALNRGHRPKDRRRRSIEIWSLDSESLPRKNEDYLVIRRQPACRLQKCIHALGRISKDDCYSVDYPVPMLPPSFRPQMLQKTKHDTSVPAGIISPAEDIFVMIPCRHEQDKEIGDHAGIFLEYCHKNMAEVWRACLDSTDIEASHWIIKRTLIDCAEIVKENSHGVADLVVLLPDQMSRALLKLISLRARNIGGSCEKLDFEDDSRTSFRYSINKYEHAVGCNMTHIYWYGPRFFSDVATLCNETRYNLDV